MPTVKSVIGSLIFAVILTEVTSWTIDLPEVRKYFFERNAYKNGDKNKINFSDRPELVKYNNIEGNSFHNTPHLHEGVNGGEFESNSHYADDYGYHTYMEKKVHGIVHKGAIYLDGLRRAMEVYSERLNNCTNLERSRPPTNRTWVPESESEPRPLNASELVLMSCEKATRESEHVRRLSSLVVWAIRELQDIAYAKDYDKETKESEEDVLLLQLAWALDELARLTGYEPDAAQYATYPTPAPTPATTPMTYFNLPIPNDGPTMSNCIKNSTNPALPATIRCAVPIPDVVLNFLNITNSTSNRRDMDSTSRTQEIMRLLTMFNNSGSGQGQQTFSNMSPEEVRQQMLGCLTNSASDPAACIGFQNFMQFLNSNSLQQQPQNLQPRLNRETDSSQLEILEAAEDHSVRPLRKQRKIRQKRSTNDPLKELAKYYVKYKAWTNANPESQDGADQQDSYVKNDLTPVKTVQKRSVNVKDGIIVRIPEDPMQDLSNYIKHKSGVNYDRNTIQADKIRAYLEKLRSNGLTAKAHVRKLEKMIKSVHKRSVHYRKLHRPHQPEDPAQDISYYVKNKPGTNIRPNLVHAARVRTGLQEIFERGNIVVIRRYGSNYIPGVAPLGVGQVESFTI